MFCCELWHRARTRIGNVRLTRVAAVATGAAVLLANTSRALALDPAFDVNQYAHAAWKVRDGSFKDSIAAIAQTPDGYLWLGTQFGLLRFDGTRHIVWQPPQGQHQLPSINVRRLFADSDGRLWIGTQLGLASWKDDRLTLHPEIPGQVGGIIEGRDGTVWAGTRYPSPGRLCAFRRESVECHGENGEFGKRASSVYEDRAGNIWVGAETGLWRWNAGGPKRYALGDFESSEGLAQTADGVFLIAERNGLKRLIDDKVVDYSLPTDVPDFQPSHLLRDRDGALWIGTFDRGLLHVRNGRVDLYAQADGLSGNYIRDIFEDREGNIWVATDNGLDRFRDTAVTTISVSQGLSQATPWSVLAASDGSVWVGTLDGLNRLKDGQITIFRKPAGLPDDLIHSLFEDDRGRIWVATRGGIAYFESGRFNPVPGIPGGVHAIAGDAAGNIWISEDESLLHVAGGRVAGRIPWATLGRKVPAIPMVADAVRGGLWLGFRDGSGLAYFKNGRVAATYGVAEGLGRGMVGDVRLESDGTVWVATDGGLSRIKNGRIHTLTAKDGLPCDGAHWATEDDDRALWLYTPCGLARIARAQLDGWARAVDSGNSQARPVQATLFDSSDGVRVHTAPGGYTPPVGKSRDGRIWFLPWDGVSVIDPRRLPFNQLPPPVHIEQITADDKSYAPTPGLRLPPLARDITIDYTALSLVAPEKIRFRYRLEGQDPQWREVLNDRRVQYSNLGPGQYHFRVMASNNSGVWNEAGAHLEFTIVPAYYQTTWFRALSVAAVVSMLGAAYRYRIRQLRHEERKLRDVVDSIPAIAGIVRPDGSTEYLNRRWMEFTGLSPLGTAGAGWHIAVHRDDKDRFVASWSESLDHGEPFEIEARLRSANGEYRWFLVRAVPVRDKRGRICNWYGVMTDIEDRKQTEKELEELSGRLIRAQEEERSRIGRELHDDISQSLGLLAIKIDQLRVDPATPSPVGNSLDSLKQDVGDVGADVHRLSHQLHSSTLDYLGLVPAVKSLVGDFSNRHGISVAFVDESHASSLPPGVALSLFRIVQESLNNIAKHSRARSVKVRITGRAEHVHLTIEDDGIGFNAASLDRHAGLGFVSMRERLRLLNGTVRVDSAPGRGTRVVVDVPVATEARDAAAGARNN
jgi:PAS domain S-box-containing protein